MVKDKTAPVAEPETPQPEEETAPVAEPETVETFVKIKMKTTSAGPDVSLNWQAGQICSVVAEAAAEKVSLGFAEYVGAV